MWKENLYQPLEILVRSREVFPIAEHQHSFFEMAYVTEGTGRFYTREAGCGPQEVSYRARSLFLIPPETTHCFTVETHSEYVFIRFVASFVEDYIGKHVAEEFLSPDWQTEISLSRRDEEVVFHLFDFIRREKEAGGGCCDYLLRLWVNSILVIVERNVSFKNLQTAEPRGPLYMLQYIQEHISQPDLLSTENLGRIFNLSPRYIGSFFKRNFQENLQKYVAKSRLRTVENLLLSSTMTVKEIAYKMGYSDSGHLVKSFRKAYGTSPLRYRRERSHNTGPTALQAEEEGRKFEV